MLTVITSVIGIYGLTLITLAAAVLPALLIDGKKYRAIVLASLVVLIVIGGWGEVRLMQASAAAVPNVRLRIVQPNVDQKRKWRTDEREPIQTC